MKKIIFICLILLHSAVWAMESVEQGIRLFNQKEYQQAQQIFQQQSDTGSAYATFWLGVTQYKNRQHFEAGDTFLKAAEMGDPWAMGVLSEYEYYVNHPCGYLGWPCDKKWYDLAIKGWKKEVEKGNGKALLQLQFFTNQWRNYIPFLGRYLIDKKYIEAFELGSLNAVLYVSRFSNISVEDEIKYLKLAANQGYAPAMEILYYRMNTIGYDEAMKWINKAIELGYAEAARTLYLAYRVGEKDRDGNVILQPDPKKAYFYNRLTGALGGEEKLARLITQEPVHDKDGIPLADENGEPVFEILVTEQEQAEMDKQVAEFVKDIKPNLFLDETSIDLF
ncbi:sel1 repeat family protein [Vibrio anguillarum]|uniref:sel1 repeat family protein n=3 Tax=Vibrio anguillarum TaxID=55601 RepID=UPI00188AAD36|nr:sel1 repeat family protein [Vibrio anguillarum]MBF4258534.1 sel1 repeat family protein [Vibrio anguillarum]MBF4278707.1 sel1 repeat family protein [Vibrio anguillarum]MBF4300166.1 sel1 repeat family protein [Vibrio anguillarum]MBF4364294.1 sel1 repeat family protein [Vibrio anguillarum]MBF4396235.1 sel1 repeat family protein [Vibrio anguillarum]